MEHKADMDAERNRASFAPSTAVDDKPELNSSASSDTIASHAHDRHESPNLQNASSAPNTDDAVDGEKHTDLEPVKSRHSVRNAGAIPNGGLTAWLQVVGAFFLFFNSWGTVNCFGFYQAYYQENLLKTSTSSAIAWCGSLQAFLLMLIGALTGPIYDRGHFRFLIISGTVLLVVGQMMLSLCTEYWQVLLAQAICIGLGCGCLFVPSVAILSTYFSSKIGTAVGLAASGSSLGGVIYPIVLNKLVMQIGFPWAVRVVGFMILGTMMIPNLCMKVRVLPAQQRSLLDLPAFKKPSYSFMVLGFFIGFMGLYMPFFYGQLYAIERRITDENLAFYLLAIMNSASVFGRIVPNYIADRLGPFNVIIPCTIVSCVLCYCFIAVDSAAGIIVLMAFYGFFSGTFVSLPPTIMVHLSLDARDKIGTRMGQSFAIVGVGLLVGTPIGGAILAASSTGFTGVWAFGGSLLAGGAVCLIAARVAFKGWAITTKA